MTIPNNCRSAGRRCRAWGLAAGGLLLVLGPAQLALGSEPAGQGGLWQGPWSLAPWLGLGLVLAYYVVVSSVSRRQREKGTTVPMFHAPQDLSPAGCRYVWRMGFDDRTLAAALVSMARKGAVVIDDAEGRLGLAGTGENQDSLTAGERAVLEVLLAAGPIEQLERTNSQLLARAKAGLLKHLKTEFAGLGISGLKWWVAGGTALTVAVWVVSLLPFYNAPVGLFILTWLSMWSTACLVMAHKVWRFLWTAAGERRGKWRAIWLAWGIALGVFSVPFFGAIYMVLGHMPHGFDTLVLGVNLLTGLVNPAFFLKLRSPSAGHRALATRIEGFRMYLKTTEADRAARTEHLGQGDLILAYMVALDLEQHWAMRLEMALSHSDEDGDDRPLDETGG